MFRSEIGSIKESFLLLEEENVRLHKEIQGLKGLVGEREREIKGMEEKVKEGIKERKEREEVLVRKDGEIRGIKEGIIKMEG